MSRQPAPYTGRFAPSPTGPLHAGSLVAALASYLDARAAGGRWLLRIDDIDPPRAAPEATGQILATLAAHHLHFDGPLQLQSNHSQAYDAALEQLMAKGLAFRCRCTRATLGPGNTCIGRCASETVPASETASLRIRVPADLRVDFDDLILGPQRVALGKTTPNFIIRRRDGLYAYQLACAVDDGGPGINHVIRGADLLDSTCRQLYIQQSLALDPPRYGHLPVLTDDQGNKLSKQTGAAALENDKAYDNLRHALTALGQALPDTHSDIDALLAAATKQWCRRQIPH